MSWHYQIRSQPSGDGTVYDIVEVYTRPFGYTVTGVAPVADSRGGLIKTLELMLRDAKKYRTITEKERGTQREHR